MNIIRRVDRSVSGAVVSSYLCPGPRAHSIASWDRAAEAVSHPLASSHGPPTSCPKSSQWLRSTFAPSAKASRPAQTVPLRRGRPSGYSTASAAARHPPNSTAPDHPPTSARDKHYLLSLVKGDDEGTADQHFDYYRDPYRRGYALPDGPRPRISDRPHDAHFPSATDAFWIDDKTRNLLQRLYVAISGRLRHPSLVSLDAIHKLYSQLPEPRMLHLTWQWRNRLMRAMGTPRKRSLPSMLRYFALVADVKKAGLTLRRSQWNFALAFAAKYTSRGTSRELESTLRLWSEMERDAKIPGNEVTFNILFDVAAKAGNFRLADMVFQEMENRGMDFNRFHHVSLIHYFGLKLDSAGIRAAYKEMVESGEMIDTVVLNCVISGLLRCGEEEAAEETYHSMKDNHSLAPEMPQRDYMMSRVITKVLMMFSRVSKKHPELKQPLQSRVHLEPDLHTYKLLVQHYAIKMGNLNKIAQFLDEMKFFKVSVHPTVFLAIFKGFYLHGGFRGSDWSEARLNGVLSALYQARDAHPQGFLIGRWLVIWALRAVKRCSSTEAVEQTFTALSQRWDIPPDRQAFMHEIYKNILQGKDMKSAWGTWNGTSPYKVENDGFRI